MRVVYVARHGCGGAQDEDAIAHALRELGHEADCVHEDQPRKAARKAAGAGLLLFHKWPEAEAAPVLRAAAGVCPRAFWYFDLVDLPGDPSVAGRCAARRRWMAAVAPHVEFAFCTDGDWAARMTAEQEVADFGPRWVWLPQGADGRVTGRGAPPPKTNKGRVPPLLFAGIDRGGGAGREAWCDVVRDRLGSLLLHVRSGVYREELRGLIAAGPVVLCPDSPLGPRYWCVDETTEALTRDGWKTHNALGVGDQVYTLNTSTGLGEWQPVTDMFVSEAGHHETVLMDGKCHSSLTTGSHRWPVYSQYDLKKHVRATGGLTGGVLLPKRVVFRTSETVRATDSIILAAEHSSIPKERLYPDDLVELLAWVWTEGGWIKTAGRYGNLTQSHRVNPDKTKRITDCLTRLYGQPLGRTDAFIQRSYQKSSWTVSVDEARGTTSFNLSAVVGSRLARIAPDHVVGLWFIHQLTKKQLRLFVENSIDADGCRLEDGRARGVFQKRPEALDSFEMACTLLGISTSRSPGKFVAGEYGWFTTVKKRTTTQPVRQPGVCKSTVHEGVVWCPVTPNGTWMARRKGRSYFTGNSNRVYNAAGFGACVLHPYNENLADQYEDGTEVVYYRSVGRMCDLAEQLVGDADGRRLIGDAALARTIRQHLYRHRVERLLAVVGEGADGRK